ALGEEVDASAERGEYREAITACERLVKERGRATDFWRLARVQTKCAGLEAGLMTLRAGLEKRPGNGFLTDRLLEYLLDGGRAQEALGLLESQASDRSESLWRASLRSEILGALGRHMEACENDERILVSHRKSDVKELVAVLERLGRTDEALQRLDRALQRKPADEDLLDSRGWLLLSRGRYADVLDNEARFTGSGSYYSSYRMMRALCGLGRHNEALQIVDHHLTGSANDTRLHEARADVLLAMGRPVDALQSAQRAIELAPANALSWWSDAQILTSLHRFEEATEAVMQAVRFGVSAHVVVPLVWDLLDHAKPEGVVCILDALDARSGSSDETTLLRARALLDLGRFQDAWASLSTRGHATDRPATWHATLVAAEAAAVSPDAALRRLEKLQKTATLGQGNDVTAWLIAKLLIVTARAHGAMALAGFLPRLRASLSSHRLVPLLAGGVVALLQDLNAHRDRITAEWDLALPRVMEALADVEDTELALQMLSVLVRHVRSGDPTVLLELPLETRQLLALPDQSAAPREA
ncbi:MAG: tetratricopeptide repeat protein, partial [Deltaproteobacteria bacterium]|nr:tetratricopeptide repeat protein [Deltaproteobacteria bacterium]